MAGPSATIGVFGGSGFYSFLPHTEQVTVTTPYGDPSGPIVIGDVGGRSVAFLPRHGPDHEFPPHAINYRANVWAMKHLGVRHLIGPCASGSLQAGIGLGDFVVCDQYIDRTSARRDTFYDGPAATHVSAADPYCPVLGRLLVQGCRDLDIPVHEGGTVVVIQGPRFSTRAESRWFAQMGWHAINMTAYPECHLARELGICYANVSLITDYDAGLDGVPGVPPVSLSEVFEVFGRNNDRLRDLLFSVIPRIPSDQDTCGTALDGAVISGH